MAFEHDDRKPYEFTWFLVASGDAGFLPPPVCSLQMVHVKKVCIYTKLPKYTSFHIIFFFTYHFYCPAGRAAFHGLHLTLQLYVRAQWHRS